MIRFSVGDYTVTQSSLWQVSISRTDLHLLFPPLHFLQTNVAANGPQDDGKYFVFQSRGNIWALAEQGNLFGKANGQHVQLTSGR